MILSFRNIICNNFVPNGRESWWFWSESAGCVQSPTADGSAYYLAREAHPAASGACSASVVVAAEGALQAVDLSVIQIGRTPKGAYSTRGRSRHLRAHPLPCCKG